MLNPIHFGGLLALAVLAGFLQIRLRGLDTRLSVRFFVVLISVALLSWPEAAAIACLSALVESAVWTKPRPPWAATAFYGAIAVLATSAAYATYHVPAAGASVSSPLLMVLAAIVYFAVNSIALAIFAARRESSVERMPAGRVWKQSFFWTFPHYVAGGSTAGLLTIADRHNGWEITLLVVPMLYWMVHAYKLYLEQADLASAGNALMYRKAARSAVTDMLTELPNTRSLFLGLDSELARARRAGQTIAVLVCELGGFKQIYDRFGRQEGDRVLQLVARALRLQCREYDTVARLSEDEFVVVLPGQNSESVEAKVERFTGAVEQAGHETVGAGSLGISVGVAYYPADGEDTEALLAAADQRKYLEKQRTGAARGVRVSRVLA